ncbi:MAG TPA: DNA methyltransferase [Smithellaceae bacterium]|nr:DNA methyltransferase [Smithellaceae bacterium]HPM10511.1 DNA methyltransferase [Paludibacter sp.]
MMKGMYKIEFLPINNVNLNENNPRLIKDEAFKRLVKSLKESPALFRARPLLCSDRTGRLVILGGNMRYLAAKKLEYTKVPVIVLTGLTEYQEKTITIKDNGSFGKWDFSVLGNAWSDLPLEDWGVELPNGWLSGSDEVIEDNFDTEAEADKITEPVTQKGDIWLLGNHKIMCGDATKKEDVEKLMGSQQGNLLLTDPPYGVNIICKVNKATGKGRIGSGGNSYSPIIGDETTETAQKIYRLSQKIGIKKIILWGGNYFTDFLPPSPCWIIWDKRVDTASNNFADCEIAWTSFTSPARIYRQIWNGYTREGKRDVEGLKRVHPTQKPVGLFAFCINNYSDVGEIILDLFLGSGPALIAAEQLGRICYGIEIDPVYCDVICKRWENLTGKKPILKQNVR